MPNRKPAKAAKRAAKPAKTAAKKPAVAKAVAKKSAKPQPALTATVKPSAEKRPRLPIQSDRFDRADYADAGFDALRERLKASPQPSRAGKPVRSAETEKRAARLDAALERLADGYRELFG